MAPLHRCALRLLDSSVWDRVSSRLKTARELLERFCHQVLPAAQ